MNCIRKLALRISKKYCYPARKCSNASAIAKEIQIPVPWGHLAVQQWGEDELAPIICMHGFADCAATFARLIPELPPTYRYLALDLPGHGRSSHLPPGYSYSNILYAYAIEKTRRFSGAEKVGLLAHSMGSSVVQEYVHYMLDRALFVVGLDSVALPANPMEPKLCHLERRIDKLIRQDNKKGKVYKDWEELVEGMMRAYGGLLDRSATEVLMARAAQRTEGGFRLSMDIKCTNNQLLGEVEDSFTAYSPPTYQNVKWCLIHYVSGMNHVGLGAVRRQMESISRNFGTIEYHMLNGKHSDHLNSPRTAVAPTIAHFLRRMASQHT